MLLTGRSVITAKEHPDGNQSRVPDLWSDRESDPKPDAKPDSEFDPEPNASLDPELDPGLELDYCGECPTPRTALAPSQGSPAG